ncbi:hypothetical protein H180DRAFT_03234 [Streptomyces sp. WMMB 322]|nr:hypothetical protein H180DRAFT_03234 [Streptomyces sp. WMMB 322]
MELWQYTFHDSVILYPRNWRGYEPAAHDP